MSNGSQIRRVIEGNETFAQGHQLVGARTYKRPVPAWALNDKTVRKMIVRAFPRMFEDAAAHASASRWASVIQLYFRLGYTRTQVAEEIGSSAQKISGVIRSILRASKGLRADGSGKLRTSMP